MAKFKIGDNVVVGPVVRYASDKGHIGKSGVIDELTYVEDNSDSGTVYAVDLGDEDGRWKFFESDLSLSTDSRAEMIRHLEEQIAKLKEEERLAERSPQNQTVGTTFVYNSSNGTHSVFVKQAENQWREFFIRRPSDDTSGVTHSAPLTDREVFQYTTSRSLNSYICKPDS